MAAPIEPEDEIGADAADASSELVKAPLPVIPELITLPSGKEMNEMAASTIATSRPARLIVTAGPVKSGKTTLLTSLYELFQWGALPAYLFAGSASLPAFEQRCHFSRLDSGADKPDTQRTIYNGPEPEYIHLRVKNAADRQKITDLLFTDVSGEMFDHASNSTDECKKLTFLHRASHFLLCLDCEKGAQLSKREGMVQQAKTILQSCLDSDMLRSNCVVTVVWTKYDYIEANAEKAELIEWIKTVESEFKTSFEQRIPFFGFHRIASRPTKNPALKMGYGVSDLLEEWINNFPKGAPMEIQPAQINKGERESELFAMRHFAEHEES